MTGWARLVLTKRAIGWSVDNSTSLPPGGARAIITPLGIIALLGTASLNSFEKGWLTVFDHSFTDKRGTDTWLSLMPNPEPRLPASPRVDLRRLPPGVQGFFFLRRTATLTHTAIFISKTVELWSVFSIARTTRQSKTVRKTASPGLWPHKLERSSASPSSTSLARRKRTFARDGHCDRRMATRDRNAIGFLRPRSLLPRSGQ